MSDGASGSNAFVDRAELEELSRNVYCVLGMPIDVIDIPTVVLHLKAAAAEAKRLFLSTPNLDFLVNFHSDPEFRDAMLLSDISPADGMPIVWLGRLLGVPIKERVAGSDIFAVLKGSRGPERPLKLFLFGGNEGVAQAAAAALEKELSGVACVGWQFPGFHTVEELSQDRVIDPINSSGADFLVVCLGGQKGQLWLKRNSEKIRVPIRSHLGAVLNFEAGMVKRAPVFMRKSGLEWLWRIKEEPYLWRRYWHDYKFLTHMVFKNVIPLMVYRLTASRSAPPFSIVSENTETGKKLRISGEATTKNVRDIVASLQEALALNANVEIDLAGVSTIDARFLGVLLVVQKIVRSKGGAMRLTGVSAGLERIIRLNGADFLLAPIENGSAVRHQRPQAQGPSPSLTR